MAAVPPHIQHFHELLDGALGNVDAKQMFGGWGFFKQERMFALAAEGTLYLKADGATRQAFEDLGCEAFTYRRGDKDIQLSYYQCPDEALAHEGKMGAWADRAFATALRHVKRKKRARSSHKRA